MTEPDDLAALDDRARRATADLAERAGARPVPPFTTSLAPAPVEDGRADGRRRWIFAAAVVVVVAGIAAAVVAIGRPHHDPATPVQTDAPRAYVLERPPPGFTLASAIEPEATTDDRDGSPLAVYGTADDDPKVGVAHLPRWSTDSAVADLAVSRTAADGTTYLDLSEAGIAPHAVLVDDPRSKGDGIMAVSADVTDEDLVDIARRSRLVDGAPRVDEAEAMASWRLLYDDPAGIFAGSSLGATTFGMAPAATATYADDATMSRSSATDPFHVLSVLTLQGPPSLVQVARLLSDDVEEVDVAGRPGLLTTTAASRFGPALQLAWSPAPGEVVRIGSVGVPRDELLAAAASVAVLSPAEWSELVTRSKLGQLGPPDGAIASGRLPDGSRWALHGDRDAGLQLRVVPAGGDDGGSEGSSGSSGSSGGDPGSGTGPGAVVAWTTTEVGDRRFLAVVIEDGAARAEVLDGTTPRTGGPTTAIASTPADRPFASKRLFVVELEDGDTSIVVLDGGGERLAEVALDHLDAGGTHGSSGSATTVVDHD